MIKNYLKEERLWFFFFLFVEFLLLFVGYLDPSLSFPSILYIALLFFVVFILFFIIRYIRKVPFIREVKEWHPSMETTSMKEAETPFEVIIHQAIKEQQRYYRQLASKQEMNLEQAKDDILTWIHEVKTPLTAMQLMIDRITDEKLKGQIMFEWHRIYHLLDQQLHQNRIGVIENDVFIEQLEIEPILYSEIKALKSWCFQKGIGFDIELQAKEILSDVKWLSFILRQILTNAVKYSEKSDIMIRSFTKNEQVCLEIKDQGRGIAVSELSRIFDKGFTSTKNHQNTAATGIGLYLAKQAAEVLKIEIEVQSNLGKGSRFTLRFAKENDLVEITGM